MNENEFEKQVEQDERGYSEPEQTPEEAPADTDAVNEFIEKIKDVVRKGNVTKIIIKRNDEILVNIPLNVGIVGGLIGVAAAPWLTVAAAAVAAAGFNCKAELEKTDGEVVRISLNGLGQKVKDVGAAVVDGIRDAVQGEQAEDPDIEVEIEVEDTPGGEAPAEEAHDEEDPTINIPVE